MSHRKELLRSLWVGYQVVRAWQGVCLCGGEDAVRTGRAGLSQADMGGSLN